VCNEFIITEERLDIIAQTFGVERDSVEKLHRDYSVLEALVKEHHLAHAIRATESYFKIKGKRGFYIEFEPFSINIPSMRNAMSAYDRDRKFTIYYKDCLSLQERRVVIAHELGHLFLLARAWNDGGTSYKPKYERTVELLSSIFGLFILTDKNHFYETLDSAGYKYPEWKNILEDFKKLCS